MADALAGAVPTPRQASSAALQSSALQSSALQSLSEDSFGAALDTEAIIQEAAAKSLVFVGEVYSQRSVVALEASLLIRMIESAAADSAAVAKQAGDTSGSNGAGGGGDSLRGPRALFNGAAGLTRWLHGGEALLPWADGGVLPGRRVA